MPENEPNIVAQLSFRLDEKKKRRFLSKVKGRGLDVKDVLTAAVDSYLDDAVKGTADTLERGISNKKVETPKRDGEYSMSAESAKGHALLELIYRSDHRVAIDAIMSNLHAFAVLVCSDIRGRGPDREIIEIPADITAEYPDIARAYAEAVAAKDADRGAGDGGTKGHRGRGGRRAG